MKKENQREDWKEGWRRHAWELKAQGRKQKDFAAALGVTEGVVSQWLKRGRGVEALRRHPAPGPQTKLSAERLAKLASLLNRGAEAHGYRGNVWTAKRGAEVIKREFGVSYHPEHCSRILRAIKHSVQKPVQWANQRDEEGKNEKCTIFVDESGFHLLPMAVRTYTPRGQTPVLRVKLTQDHLSTIVGSPRTVDSSCRLKTMPTRLRMWFVSCRCCCARSPTSCW
jgi:transposase